MRIAICEDNPIHAKILMRMIEKWQEKVSDSMTWNVGKPVNCSIMYWLMWEKENLTVIWPLYIPTTRIPTFHIRQEKAVLGRTRCTFIRFRQENFREIRNCYHRIRDGRCSNNRFPSCYLDWQGNHHGQICTGGFLLFYQVDFYGITLVFLYCMYNVEWNWQISPMMLVLISRHKVSTYP